MDTDNVEHISAGGSHIPVYMAFLYDSIQRGITVGRTRATKMFFLRVVLLHSLLHPSSRVCSLSMREFNGGREWSEPFCATEHRFIRSDLMFPDRDAFTTQKRYRPILIDSSNTTNFLKLNIGIFFDYYSTLFSYFLFFLICYI